MNGPRILLLDIETSPHKVYSWNTYKTVIYPDFVIEPSRAICWAAKWLEEKPVFFKSEYHQDNRSMLLGIRDMLDAADVAVAYNGDRFDVPRLNQQFRLNGIPYPSPYTKVDLYKVIKKIETWPFHKLSWITTEMGMSGKLDPGGIILWRECLGDFGEDRQRKAWAKMRRYNKRDVVTLEEVFHEYRGDITNLPSPLLWSEDKDLVDTRPTCPNCGSTHVTRQGYKRTKTRRYPQYQCQGCGKWFSETRSEMGVQSA
jgi:DNA polymerase elongation subunit (family B)